MFEEIINFIRSLYGTEGHIPLHEPRFIGNEKKYLEECIDSTFVSSVGKFVDLFEEKIAEYTGAKHAVVTVNGTEALHIALLLSGVKPGDEVIMQPLTFIATANSIKYVNAHPVFTDIDRDTLGLSPEKLQDFFRKNTVIKNGTCMNIITGRKISACVSMHTFGHPARIDDIINICDKYHINVIEDAAESIGSKYKGRHTGTFGMFGVLSFNGNKILTSGGGGMILTNDTQLAKKAKHITTQAKVPHPWEYIHDEVGYNYRMPNINAALGLAQLENLDTFIISKRSTAEKYRKFFDRLGIEYQTEPVGAYSNYWLNAIYFNDQAQRDAFLEFANSRGVQCRPAWRLMNKLEMYKDSLTGDLSNASWVEERLVNIPSSVIIPE